MRGFKPMTRIAEWVVHLLPAPLIRDSERIGLSIALAVVGVLSIITAVFPEPGYKPLLVPFWVFLEWTATLIIGGCATVIGMWRSNRQVERFGLMLLTVGTFTYALSLILRAQGEPRLYVGGCLFLLLGVIKFIRLCASTAGAGVAENLGE